MRAIPPFLITVALFCVGAPVVGAILVGVLTKMPKLVIMQDLAAVPVLLYASLSSLPIVLPVALVAAFSALLFSFYLGPRHSLPVWVLAFAGLGLFVGVACASPMIWAAARESEMSVAAVWGILGALCGVAGMSLVAGVWYFFFKVR